MYLLVLSFAVFILSQIILQKNAKILNLVDKPNNRKKHVGEIPMVGGISIFLSIFTYSFLVELDRAYELLILSSILIFISGILDDLYGLKVSTRIIFHLLATLIMIYAGYQVNNIGYYDYFGNLDLSFFSIPFTIIAVLLLTNAFNWIDGLDGLAAAMFIQSLIVSNIFIFINNLNFNIDTLQILLILNITIFLFINLNFLKLGKSFLGNSGSVLLGYLLAWTLIFYVFQKDVDLHPILIAWSISYPIFDITYTLLKRALLRKNLFRPDRNHLHHFLQDRKFEDRSILFALVILSLILSLLGGLIFYIFGAFYSLILFIIFYTSYLTINLYFIHNWFNNDYHNNHEK
tara:strand:- start:1120 stop:2160 length:1041 start_codon:yes stop_codon:yes gene_type:complete